MKPDRASAPADSGMARERTRLAWRRTVLTALVVGLLFVRLATRGGSNLPAAGVIAGAAAGWLALAAVAQRRIHALAGSTGRNPTAVARLVRAAAFVAVTYAALGLVLVWRAG